MVALTLPAEVVRGLRKLHPDLGWAIVTLFEKAPARVLAAAERQPDAELVTIADRRSLIVVNRAVFKSLPGINIIPLHGSRAFLALDLGRGMSDLELAVIDRLGDPSVDLRERKALRKLRLQLRTWRHDHALRFHTRAIIVVERLIGRDHKRPLEGWPALTGAPWSAEEMSAAFTGATRRLAPGEPAPQALPGAARRQRRRRAARSGSGRRRRSDPRSGPSRQAI